MSDFDLTVYDQMCATHLLEGLARYINFDDAVGDAGWNVDMESGTLSLEGHGDFDCQLLGTFNPNDDTFLWSWANPGADDWDPSTTDTARQLKAMGEEQPGMDVFVERKVAEGWVGHMELGLVASALAGLPLFVRDAGGPIVLMLVHVEVPGAVEPVVWPRCIMALPEVFGGALAPVVHGYLERFGRVETASPQEITGVFPGDARFTVSFDAQGRIAGIQGRLQGE